ncbi:MAG TPA: hypothetical protein VGQ47_03820 [Candidatus Limnocylindrales bacterium]|jgi:hypothetical protein|nr:hypothetical protein [Candidatus Limnocylindrales bacterium]
MTADVTRIASRRAMLAAGAAGLLGAIAHAFASATQVRAANGDAVLLGQTNTATEVTTVQNTDASEWAFAGMGSDTGVGLRGEGGVGVSGFSDLGTAVEAHSNSGRAVNADSGAATEPAVRARSLGFSSGVLGYSGVSGAQPFPTGKTGVEGVSEIDSTARGVYGRSTVGRGVMGSATTGTALYAVAATNGTALRTTRGHVRFSTAGLATIAAGTNSVTVTPGFDISSGSKVLAVLQGNPGAGILFRFVRRDSVNDRFTIYLSGNATANTPVAWFVIG